MEAERTREWKESAVTALFSGQNFLAHALLLFGIEVERAQISREQASPVFPS
jgi:hypothetical protein